MRIIAQTLLAIFISNCGVSKNQIKMNYSLRNNYLSKDEITLVESINLETSAFDNIFKDILLSEIIHNSKERGFNRDNINGLIFCGKKIELNDYLELRERFARKGLVIEVTLDEMIYYRFKDFKFPYIEENVLKNISKNYYKIYEKSQGLSFTEQCYYVENDKTELNIFYNTIVQKYKGFAIWADYDENLLYVPNNKSDELINLIYNFRDKVYPKKYGIDNGWYTEKSLKDDIKEKLPFIDFGFYE